MRRLKPTITLRDFLRSWLQIADEREKLLPWVKHLKENISQEFGGLSSFLDPPEENSRKYT
jgi:hypothetical protein